MLQFKFSSLHDFITMSGHGAYVWTCFFITVGCYIFLVARPLYLKKIALKKIAIQNRIKEQAALKHHENN